MLQDIRQNVQGTAAKIVVGIIVVSFAFFGIESILLGGGGDEIAQVNGEDIYPGELQQAINSQKRRLMSMMGENLDPSFLEDDRLRGPALESLISRKVLMQSVMDRKLAVSEAAIGALIGNMEQFQVEGKFSADVYRSALSSAGYTPSYFKQSLRDDMLVNQLRNGLAGSEFATPAELSLNARIVGEQRDVRYITVPQERFALTDEPAEAQIEAYYSSHQERFRTVETVDLDYIELTPADFEEAVPESAIVEAYELAKENAQYQTQNRVSHILLDSSGEESIESRLVQIQAQLSAGESFADVARAFSDDAGSADNGGDLGYSSGDAFPEPMELALADLQVGEVSEPVDTDAGTHLVVVTERNESKAPELEEMRERLQEEIQMAEARVVLLRTVESLRDLSFNAEDLNTPATELGLEVKQLSGVSRNQLDGLISNPALLAAAFSDDVLGSRNNSDVMEIAGGNYVVLRVHRHNPPELKPQASVRPEIIAAILREDTRIALAAEANRALAVLRSGTSVEQFANAESYQWQVELGVDRRNTTLPADVLRRAFELPVPGEGQTATDYITVPSGDAVIIELVRVNAGDYAALDTAKQLQLEQQLSGEFGSLIDTEFQRGLRLNADIVVR